MKDEDFDSLMASVAEARAFAQGQQVPGLRDWEQGRRQPEGPARVLLSMLARDPGIVARVLI